MKARKDKKLEELLLYSCDPIATMRFIKDEFPYREWNMIYLLTRGYNYREISEIHNLSQWRTQQIVGKLLRRMMHPSRSKYLRIDDAT